MAQIQIPGIGAVEVPDFATDYTLNQVLAVLSSQEAERVNALGAINQTLVTESNIARASLARDTTISSNTGQIANAQRVQNKSSQDTLQHMKSQHKQMLSETKRASGLWTTKMPQVMRIAGSMMTGKSIGDALSMLPGGLGQGVALATKVVGEFADSQRALTDVGYGLGVSVIKTGEEMSKLGIPLSELERIASTNAVTLDYLNDAQNMNLETMKDGNKGVKQGVFAFGQLSKNVQDSMDKFGNMGFTVTEINSYLTEYLETDRKRGVQAKTSFDNLSSNFHLLALETAAYAADTGRNRKDLMKSQLENLNRTDAVTYALSLRLAGEEQAAVDFEANVGTLTADLESKFGKEQAAKYVDAFIQAKTQGRGIEATEFGAELSAMAPAIAAKMNDLTKVTGKFSKENMTGFKGAMESDFKTYGKDIGIISKNSEALQTLALSLANYRHTDAESREKHKKRMEDEDEAGVKGLKANRLLVKTQAALQQAFLAVADKLIDKDGALVPLLDGAIKSVGTFAEALASFAAGKPGDGLKKLGEMPGVFAALFGVSAAGMATSSNVIPSGSRGGKNLAKGIAMQNIKGATLDGSKVMQHGAKIGDLNAKGKFMHGNVEYSYDSKSGKFAPTKSGIKAITGGNAKGLLRGAGGATLSGVFIAAQAVFEGVQRVKKENDAFGEKTKGWDKKSTAYKKADSQKTANIKDIMKDVAIKGTGSIAGSAIMGGIMGTLGAGPFGTIIGTMLGAWAGWKGGELVNEYRNKGGLAHSDPDAFDYNNALSKDQNNLADVAQNKLDRLEEAQSNPSYLKLDEIRKLLDEQLLYLQGLVGLTDAQLKEWKKSKGF